LTIGSRSFEPSPSLTDIPQTNNGRRGSREAPQPRSIPGVSVVPNDDRTAFLSRPIFFFVSLMILQSWRSIAARTPLRYVKHARKCSGRKPTHENVLVELSYIARDFTQSCEGKTPAQVTARIRGFCILDGPRPEGALRSNKAPNLLRQGIVQLLQTLAVSWAIENLVLSCIG
jgi:hypothetical protein